MVTDTDFPAPTALDATDFSPDATTAGAALDTSSPSGDAAPSSGFLHNTPAVAGTFTALGLVVVGALLFLIFRRVRQRSQANFDLEDDYVVTDRSGRTGFASVNFGQPATEMSERQSDYGSGRPYADSDVEHTLGQEIIQQAPFDPFHNNFTFLDSEDRGAYQSNAVAFGQHQHQDLLDQDDAHSWTSAAATPDPAAQYRNSYSHHPYSSDAVHVTPLRRQPSERAEYGLAC